ncbi:alcohol oxidase-like protein [Dichomitus squalens]|nr:alcohol oxidase-like protein [Dichomitus squalens]
MTTPQLFDEYDIIFAGGGTTAGIIVGRLAAADPSLRILILETGPHTQDDLSHTQPARFLTHLQPGSKTIRNVVAKPSKHLNGRELAVQCGQCVGGGSSVNFAMYTRAPASDYDDWARLYDNPGWSWADLLPLMKKAETYQNAPNRPTHGYSGPLKVSYGGKRTNVGEDYIATVSKYDKTRVIVDDANRMVDDVNRHEFWPKWIDGNTGHRSDVAHNYLYKVLKTGTNVHLLPGYFVKKVIIEDGRATGVEFVRNAQVLPDVDGTIRVAQSKQLVVLSAGAFGSAAILERSGIGRKDVLERNGIEQKVDLPMVGENYNDHHLFFLNFHASEDAETIDGIVRNDPGEIEKWSAQWSKDGKGLMATNGCDGGMKYRPSPEELRTIGPDFADSDLWRSFYAPSPDKPVLFIGMISQYVGTAPPPPDHKCYCTFAYLTYPVGTGSVHITSADDVTAPVDFDSGVCSRKEDFALMRHMYKVCREYGRRMDSYRGEIAADHPKFAASSAAAVPEAPVRPVSIDAADIVYSAEDERALDDFIRSKVQTAWHSLGTCAMKPHDKGGVVDSRLNVYGVQALKIADMSIAPSNVATNTYSTAITIGEKAAIMIAEDLGIKGV